MGVSHERRRFHSTRRDPTRSGCLLHLRAVAWVAVVRASGGTFTTSLNTILNDIAVNDTIAAGASLIYNYRWCFTTESTRTIQSTFSGIDANGNAITVSGAVVTLTSPGDDAFLPAS